MSVVVGFALVVRFLRVVVLVFLVEVFLFLVGFDSSTFSTSCFITGSCVSSVFSRVASIFSFRVARLACKKLANFLSNFLLIMPSLLYLKRAFFFVPIVYPVLLCWCYSYRYCYCRWSMCCATGASWSNGQNIRACLLYTSDAADEE